MTSDTRVEIVFLDTGVEDGQQLLADLLSRDGTNITQVHLIDSNSDGVDQIAQVLAGQQGIDAIHIISHGAAGQIQLGSGTLSTGSLDGYAGQLNDWGSALADAGDILIYGCDLAADAQGEALVNAIGILTGADVAASVDQTGHAAQGGDWDLEYRAGAVETVAFTMVDLPVWQGTLGSITVTTTADTLDGDADTSSLAALAATPGSDGFVSLREAVIAANNTNEADTITLSSGIYRLDLTGGGPDEQHGDLDVSDPIHIVGSGASSTIIDGNLTDRIFEFGSDADGSSISGVTMQNADSGTGDGGAILTQRALTITDAELTGNTGKNGGAILANDTLILERVTIAGNTALNGGGVLLNSGAGHSLTNVTISGNTATNGAGGGLDIRAATSLTNVTIANNSAWTNGGGVHEGGASVTVTNTLIADNTAGTAGNDAFGTFTSDASNLSRSVPVQPDDTSPSISMDDDGNFIVVYEGSGDGAGFGVFGQKFDSNSNPIGGEFQINQTATGTQDQVSVAMLDSDNFVAAWSGNGSGDTDGVFARNYGTGVPGIVQAAAPATDNTNEDVPLVFSTGGGNAITVSDSTAANTLLRATLTVTNGVLDLATTVGLTSVTGDGTATVVVAGTESAINTALDGLTYTPTPSYSGPANLQLTVDLQSDLEGRYDFTQPGGLGVDSSPGGGDDGTPSGPGAAPDPNVTFDAQRNSDVLVLDGVDDNVIVPGLFGTPTNVTLAAWVNVAAVGGQEVITLGNSIALRLDDGGGGNGVTGFFHDGSTWRHTDSSQFVGGDGWHHVAFTFDDSSNTQVIYIDGVALGTTSYTASINYAHEPNTVIGSLAGVSGYWLDGMLDDVRVYDHALGASEIEALANDASSDNVSVSITVDNVNDAPTITSTAVTTATEDAAYSYTFAVNDVDVGDTLTLSAPTLPAWLSFDPATGILSGTPSNAEVGTHNVVLRVNDGTVDVDESFTITVSNANDAPTITSTAVTTATEDAAYSYTFAVNDVDVGDTLTLSAPTLPAWLSFDPATGILSGTPSNAEVGTHNVVLRVNDGTVDVDESFTITVSNANDAPTITSTAVTTATEDAAYSYTFTVNDVDVGDTLTLSAPTLPAWLSFDPATGILSGTPSNAEVGTHNVVLRVNDGTVDVDESFTITVSNANDAPTITSTAVTTATEDAAYSYTFTVNDVDVGDTLTLSAPTLPAWLSFDPATGILSGTPSNAEVGTHNVVLRVNDGTVDVDESFTITVSNANDAPTITSTAVTTATEDAAYSYTFTVNDVDVGDTLTLSAPTLPAWLSFDPATGILSGTPTNAEVGTHNVVLRVNDGTVDVDESFTITVSNANDAPTITSTAVTTATEDAAYSYTFAVNDVDVGDTLTLSAPTLPAWLSFDPATGILSGTPSNAEVGTHNVVLRVNDGTVDVDESFTITVSNANDAPTITSTAVTTATEDAAYSYTFAVNDVDVGDTLTLSAPTLPAWLSFDPATGILSGTPSNAEVGTHNVVLRVNDGTVDVDESFTITVSNANDAPTITSTAVTTATEDAAYSYTFAVNDVDVGDTLTLSAPTLPAWLSFDPATGILSGTPSNAEVGTHNVVLRVNDGTVDVDESFTITVSNANDAPTITSTAVTTATEDAAYSYTFAVNDVDVGDTLTLSAPTLPAWLSFDPATGILSGTPSNAEVGTHNVVLRVNDGTVDVDESFTITVSNTNDAPTITSTAVTTATEDAAYSYTFTVNDVDVGDTLTLSAPTLPAWLSFDPATGILSGTPTNAEVGTHGVVLRVTDGTVDVDESFTITVGNTNDAPTITSTAVTTATEDAPTATALRGSDVDAATPDASAAPTSRPG